MPATWLCKCFFLISKLNIKLNWSHCWHVSVKSDGTLFSGPSLSRLVFIFWYSFYRMKNYRFHEQRLEFYSSTSVSHRKHSSKTPFISQSSTHGTIVPSYNSCDSGMFKSIASSRHTTENNNESWGSFVKTSAGDYGLCINSSCHLPVIDEQIVEILDTLYYSSSFCFSVYLIMRWYTGTSSVIKNTFSMTTNIGSRPCDY